MLRAEQLSAARRPSAIVVGFIPDDIRRTEMSRQWGAEKPTSTRRQRWAKWGAGAAQRARCRRGPIRAPRSRSGSACSAAPSCSTSPCAGSALLYDWFGDHVRVHPPGDGERIACLLTERLRELQTSSGARVIVLAEYDPMVWQKQDFSAEQRRLARGLLDCARKRGLATIDSYEALAMAPRRPAKPLRAMAHERQGQPLDRGPRGQCAVGRVLFADMNGR